MTPPSLSHCVCASAVRPRLAQGDTSPGCGERLWVTADLKVSSRPAPPPRAGGGGKADGSVAGPSVAGESPAASLGGSSVVDSRPGTRMSPGHEHEFQFWVDSRFILCVLALFVM